MTGLGHKTTLTALKDENGRLILHRSELQNVWRSYAETLFGGEREGRGVTNAISGLEILESQVKRALEQIKNEKSSGPVKVYAEVLKLANTKHLTYLFKKIHNTGKILFE